LTATVVDIPFRVVTRAVGIDLTAPEEVRRQVDRHGDRYLARVYTPAEIAECGAAPHRLAERFAAKEAVLKALAWPLAEGIPWRELETAETLGGGLSVILHGRAAARAEAQEVRSLLLSPARAGSLAGAVAVAQKATP
jgi:holo-[acyl-carrier protein] synthase